MSSLKKAVATLAILTAVAAVAFAQVPTRTKIRYNVAVPFELTMGGYILSPGHYILHQDSMNPNLFRLYETDMTHAPLATIYTVRGRYWTVHHGGSRPVFSLDVDESSQNNRRVLKAFDVPFDDPWEVVSVTAKSNSPLIRAAR